MVPRKPWEKNLFSNKEYDDNYTDPLTFLKDLKKNYNIQQYSFIDCFCGCTKVSQEISCITLFLILFYALYLDEVNPQNVFLNSFILTATGYIVYIGTDITKFRNIIEDLKTVAAVLLFGYMFSPLLHTLTDSISTDTIFSSTFIILFFHLLLHDYGVDGFLVSRTVSLNCGIVASICLASRLSSSFHAFVLLVISAEVFALKPLLFDRIWHPVMVLPFVAITCYLLFNISILILTVYLMTLIFVNLFCPYIFHKLHKNKCTISGPWDEALIIEEKTK
ncbi:unnamed protein product [Diamesa serratosioi]